jgi:hypothetical protein
MTPQIKAWFYILASAFAGGALAYLGIPHPSLTSWQVIAGAVLAGLGSAWHRYSDPPSPGGPTPPAALRGTGALLVLMLLTACPAFWSVMGKIAQGAQTISAIVSAIEPELPMLMSSTDEVTQQKVRAALNRVKASAAALDAGIATAKDANDGALVKLETDAIADYEALFALVKGLPPPPAMADRPKPYQMPEPVLVRRSLGVS